MHHGHLLHAPMTLCELSLERFVPGQVLPRGSGSLLREAAISEARDHRHHVYLCPDGGPTCYGSDRFPPCFRTECSSCFAGPLR